MTSQDIAALRDLRAQFEESTPAPEWPQAAAGEMMLLCDVVHALGGDDDQARAVLGEPAFVYVSEMVDAGGAL